MNTHSRNPNIPDDDGVETPNSPPPPPPPHDELDALLRQWHATNAERAAAGRDRLMESLAQESARAEQAGDGPIPFANQGGWSGRITVRKILFNRYVPLAAAAVVLAVILPFVLPSKTGTLTTIPTALASNVMMVPEGGRLEALDRTGNLMGPCAIKHTDVKAEISGRFSRVTVTQEYHNPYKDKIEAVYTFPLSDRGGVDRMTMTIGDRVIVGEVKERESARRIYEQARESGRTASLLEQERPNIFTQSVANIDPGATIKVEISYVETVVERDGELAFEFPTVVSPRYVPGSLLSAKHEVRPLPAGARARDGVVLAAPASVAAANRHAVPANDPGERTPATLETMLAKATAIETPEEDPAASAPVWYDSEVAYPDGSKEPVVLLADGRGEVGGRWFYCPVVPNAAPGEPFAQPTNQVPDADRITPTPTRPNVRAGHDVSISVTLDTGGPGIVSLDSPMHKTVRTDLAKNALEQPRRVSIALANLNEIPNRDFVLKWKQTADTIANRVFTNTGEHGNFFSLQLEPPARVDDDAAVPRELVFVVDTSGSMNGRPISLCRQVMQKATDAMRPQDTFNIITFAGATKIMWERPRPNTEANRAEAQKFIETWQGAGGTEMMTAIEAALRQTPEDAAKGTVSLAQLANLPADGRSVSVVVDDGQIDTNRMEAGGLIRTPSLVIRDDLRIRATDFTLPQRFLKRADQTVADDSVVLRLLVHGTWATEDGQRLLRVTGAEMFSDTGVRPLRIVMFLTDAEVGNDFAIIDAIKRNRATTRVFPFGIGNSVNRFLIEQMAVAGGGEPDYVYATQASDADANAAVERFNRRTRTPVLTDISLKFDGVEPLDVLPGSGNIPDLYDNRPLTFLGRYTQPGVGAVTIKGQTARGPWQKTVPLSFPVSETQNSSLPTLWARAKIDALMATDLRGIQSGLPSPEVRSQIITLGETFGVMSQYTSFVAVDKLRVTINGRARLVRVPVELPDQTNWEGYFGLLGEAGGGMTESGEKRSGNNAADAAGQPQVLRLNERAINELVACGNTLADQTDKLRAGATMADTVSGTPSAKAGAELSPPPSSPPPPPPPPPPPSPATWAHAPAVAVAPSAAPPPGVPGSGGATARAGAGGGPRGSTGAPAAAKEEEKAKRDPGRIVWGESASTGARGETGKMQGMPQTRRLASGVTATRGLDRQAGGTNWSTSAANSADFGTMVFNGGLPSIAARSETGRSLFSRGDSDGESKAGGYMYFGYADSPGGTFVPAASQSLVALAAAQLADEGRLSEAKTLACSNLAGDLALALATPGESNPAAPPAQQTTSNASPVGVHQALSQKQQPISQICGALSSQLPDAAKKAAIDEARAEATAQILEARKAATVYRKLGPELFGRTERGQTAMQSQDLGIQTKDGPRAPEPFRKDARPQGKPDAGSPMDANGAATVAMKSASETKASAIAPPIVLVAVLCTSASAETLEALKSLGFAVEIVRPEASVVIGRIPAEKLEALALLAQVRRVEPVPDENGASMK